MAGLRDYLKMKTFKITEHQLQKSIFDYVEQFLPALRPFMFAIPNGGLRNIIVARKLKAEGVTPGVWDIILALPYAPKHGLFIECKVGKNKLTDNQEKFAEKLKKQNYCFAVVRSLEDFKQEAMFYLKTTKLTNPYIKTLLLED